jgi:hypothetical protein
MSKKNRNNRANETGPTAVLDAAQGSNRTNNMSREELIAAMKPFDEAVGEVPDYTNTTDDELREYLGLALADVDPNSPPDEGGETKDPEVVGADQVSQDGANHGQVVAQEVPVEEQLPNPQPDVPVEETTGTVAETAVVHPPPARWTAADALADVPAAARAIIMNLQAEIEKLKARGSGKRVASGSKARPNVKYTLLSKPPAWHNTPQVAQLEQILFAPEVAAKFTTEVGGKPVVQLTEPDIFALIEAGQKSGILRTKQNPVRIFQYYRSELLNANVLRWQ